MNWLRRVLGHPDRVLVTDKLILCNCGNSDLEGIGNVHTSVMRKGVAHAVLTGAAYRCWRCNAIFGVSGAGRFDLYTFTPAPARQAETQEALKPLPLRPVPRERQSGV